MVKDDALVVQETTEIVELLPVESRFDLELVKAIAGSLREGHDRHVVEIQAIQLAHQRLEAKVDHGFLLVNHELEKERIHRNYLQENLNKLHNSLDRVVDRVQSVATQVVYAEAKAESARETAKNSRWANFDPLTGMTVCAIGIVALLCLFSTKIEVKDKPVTPPPRTDLLTCGVNVTCIPNQSNQPVPARGGV